MKGVTTQEFDHGFKRIVKELKILEGKPFVKVGFQGAKGDAQHTGSIGSTVTGVAVCNEFGTSTIPERPFMRSTFDIEKDKWSKRTAELADLIYLGKTNVKQALGILGQTIQQAIKDRIKNSREWAAANAESTYMRKLKKGGSPGEVVPLIDTAQMINATSYQTVMKSSCDDSNGVESK